MRSDKTATKELVYARTEEAIKRATGAEKRLLTTLIRSRSEAFAFDSNIEQLSQSPPVLQLRINPDLLQPKNMEQVERIFSYFLDYQNGAHPVQLKIVIDKPQSNKEISNVEIDHHTFNSSFNVIHDLFLNLFRNNMLVNPVILAAFYIALSQHHVPITPGEWRKTIYDEIKDRDIALDIVEYPATLDHLCQDIYFLYRATNDNALLEQTLPHLFALLLYTNQFELMTPWLEIPEFLKAIDINHADNDGNTALHLAAIEGDAEKARFLLRHGANPDLKNEAGRTFWNVNTEVETSLQFYRLYKAHGNVLKFPPQILKQRGINCGFYAVASAVAFHHQTSPTLFKHAPLPARKRDTVPKAKSSLRQLRHEFGILGEGAIFSAKHLQQVIEKTECKSLVVDIHNFEQFMEVIQKAIDLNLPVIIPFSVSSDSEGQPNPAAKSDTAHWATVIGWAREGKASGVLLAQYGQYYDTKADQLFHSFYNIEPLYPERHLHKPKGKEWKVTDKPVDMNEGMKTSMIPLTSLEDFRRKLILVLPPDYDMSLLHFDRTAPSPASS